MTNTNPKRCTSSKGFSLIEMLIVLALMGILTAVALPAMISQRRLIRSTTLTRDITTQMRYARQLSMSLRQSITFQYDDGTKSLNIINHNNSGSAIPACNLSRTAIFAATGFPNTACSTVVASVPLTQGGLPASEIVYGIPSGLPAVKLGDNIVMTPLAPVGAGGKLNITFQPDGSVVDAAGIPVDRAMYFFNNKAEKATASAISIVGASGRVKVWRYKAYADTYTE